MKKKITLIVSLFLLITLSACGSNETKESNSKKIDITDMTNKTPTDSQQEVLQALAEQQFKKKYPYDGSKMHTVLGVLNDWESDGTEWYYKVEATIVNSFGAKKDTNLEVHITPVDKESGLVSFITY